MWIVSIVATGANPPSTPIVPHENYCQAELRSARQVPASHPKTLESQDLVECYSRACQAKKISLFCRLCTQALHSATGPEPLAPAAKTSGFPLLTHPKALATTTAATPSSELSYPTSLPKDRRPPSLPRLHRILLHNFRHSSRDVAAKKRKML